LHVKKSSIIAGSSIQEVRMAVSSEHPWRSASPEHYEIRIEGALDRRWFDWFDPLQVSCVDAARGETVLSGALPDQAALHGILARVRDLNLKLISVRRISAGNDLEDRQA
jgi:hypothetical protein